MPGVEFPGLGVVTRTVRRVRNGAAWAARIGEPEVGLSPSDTVWSYEKAQLWRYRRTTPPSRATPLVMVHSLVSRSYVLDLTPANSFVQRFLDAGFDVYLLDWGVVDDEDATTTLEDLLDRYVAPAVRAAAATSGTGAVTLLGYCFAGVLVLLAAARHRELPVRNLVTMATAVDFTRVGLVGQLFGDARLDPGALLDRTGNLPPATIARGITLLRPTADLVAHARLWQHLDDRDYVDGLRAMARWHREHVPFPGQVLRQGVELFVRQHALMRGVVPLAGGDAVLRDVTQPLLAVVGEDDYVVPLAAAEPITSLVGSADATLLRLPAGHVAFVAGREAARSSVPRMVAWLAAHDGPGGPDCGVSR